MENKFFRNASAYSLCIILLVIVAIGISGCRKKGKLSGAGAEVTLLGSLEVTPKDPVLELGDEIDLTAVALENSPNNITIDQSAIVFTWEACSEDLAVVKANGAIVNVRAKSPGTCVLSVSTASFGTLQVSVVINEPKIVGIKVAPADTIGQIGGSVDFTALAEYSDKSSQNVTDQVAWVSKPANATQFSATHPGRASIVLPGKSKITATYSGFSGEAKLDVADVQLARMLIVSEGRPNLQGVTQQFRNIGIYDDGSTVDLTALTTWSVSNAQVADVNNEAQKGLSVLLQTGSCTITASYNNLTSTTDFTVASATLTSISISPSSFPLAAGYFQNLSITGTYSDGTILDLTTAASWSSENSGIAEVSNSLPTKGLVSGVATGNTRINATVLGLTAHSKINVTAATIESLDINPTSLVMPVGSSKKFQLGATFSDDSYLDVTSRASWLANNTNINVGNIEPNKGLVKAKSTGATAVEATIGALSVSSAIDVSAAALTSITITPNSVGLAPLAQQRLKAVATFDDATTLDYTEFVEWSSSDTSKIVVLNSDGVRGNVIALASGSSNVTATFDDISGSAAVSVSAGSLPVVSSIVVTPTSASISASTTQQFTATALYSDGSTQNITTSASWVSSNTSAATINSTTGALIGIAAGQSVVTANKDGLASSAQVLVTVDQASPPTPTGLAASSPSSTSLTFSWSSGGGTTASYRYAYQSGGSAPADCSSGTTGSTEGTSVVLNNLSPATQYTMIVCAINADTSPDLSSASVSATGTTLVTAPTSFTIIDATNGDTESIVSWNNSPGATTYTLKYGTSPGNYTFTVSANAVSPTTITGLSNGTTYYFMVVAVNPGGNRNATAEKSATPAAVPPPVPTGFAAVTNSSNPTSVIDLSWTDMGGDTGGYKIAYKSGAVAPTNCDEDTTATSATNTTSKTISGLQAATQYTFIICNINTVSGHSAASSGVSVYTKPSSPTSLGSTVTSSTELTLDWDDMPNDTDGYKISYLAGNTAPANCTVGTTSSSGTDSKTLTGLDPSTQYSFAVCTSNTLAGQSLPAVLSVRTKPSSTSGLNVTTVSTTELNLTWTNATDDDNGYKIAYQSGASAPASCTSGSTTTASTNVTTKSITGLTPGTQYSFTICTSSSTSGDSLPAAAVSKYTKPNAPTISVAVDSSSQITLSWSAVTGDTGGYKIAYKSGATAPANCDADTTTTAVSGATSKVLSSLGAGTQYTFIACTVNSDSGQSSASTSNSGTTSSGSNSQTYTSGSGTFSVPVGVTSVVVEVWGAGGGGGSGKDGGTHGGSPGGGGGAYCKKTLAVSPSDSISYVVGLGGPGGSSPGETDPGGTGGTSTATYSSETYTANGGTGGASFSGTPVGAGGTASNCDENRTGGSGSVHTGSAGGGGGSSAATGSDGTTPAATTTGGVAPSDGGSGGNGGSSDVAGSVGSIPGGGGGGGGKRANGGNGANGTVKFSW